MVDTPLFYEGRGNWSSTPPDGSAPVVWRGLDVSHDTPDLRTGIEWWTPAAGDIFACIYYYTFYENCIEAWDGTTPTIRIGSILDGVFTDLTPITTVPLSSIPSASAGNGFVQAGESSTIAQGYIAPGEVPVGVLLDDGAGGDPGVSVGRSILYLATATPVVR